MNKLNTALKPGSDAWKKMFLIKGLIFGVIITLLSGTCVIFNDHKNSYKAFFAWACLILSLAMIVSTIKQLRRKR